MKKVLLIINFLSVGILFAQVPSGAIAGYRFTAGSFENQVNPGTGVLIPSGNGWLLRADRDGNPDTALRNRQESFTGINFTGTSSNPMNEFTVSFWYYFENEVVGSSSPEGILQAFDNSGADGFRLTKNAGGNFAFRIQTTLTNRVLNFQSANLATQRWTHVVISLEENNGNYEAKAYLDGQQVNLGASATWTEASTLFNSTAPFIISPIISNFGLRSATDDFYVYPRALTQTEVTQLFNQPGLALLSRVYVDPAATGSPIGDSWQNAVTDLQTAVDRAATGAEIWVKAGTVISRSSDRSIPLVTVDKQLTFLGGFDGTETAASQRDPQNNISRISGDFNGDDIATVQEDASRGDNTNALFDVQVNGVVLDGLTLSDAQGADSLSSLNGSGAILVRNNVANFTIRDCIIERNLARERGSAVRYEPLNTGTSVFVMERCIIRNNLTARGGVDVYARGGTNLQVNIYNSLFHDNVSADLPGPTTGNSGSSLNLGVNVNETGQMTATVANCTFANNREDSVSDSTAGTIISSQPTNRNLMTLNVYNSVFADNLNSVNGLSRQVALAPVGNGAYNLIFESNMTDRDFSSVPNSAENNTLVVADPAFVDQANRDYGPATGSPLIDAGDNNFVFYTIDLLGNNRFVNGPTDIGAIEFQTTASIDELDLLQIKIYPNPASDVIYVDCGEHAFAKARLHNLQGQLIKSSSRAQMDVSSLKSGFYIISLELEGGLSTEAKVLIK